MILSKPFIFPFSLFLASSFHLYGQVSAKQPPAVIDYTKAKYENTYHDWNLGPTGARGGMWGWKTETSHARQIYVTAVQKDSPADGVLVIGDVILGLEGELFEGDARHAFGKAISKAEAGSGKLLLTCWRKGETKTLTIQIPALGEYSDTAPFNCKKSQIILSEGCEHIAQRLKTQLPRMRQSSWNFKREKITYTKREITAAIDALALLSSGDPAYSDLVAEYAHGFAPQDLTFKMTSTTGLASWGWGYINLFLCEYYLYTQDKKVLPAIEAYASSVAKGQSFIGSWGHTMAWPDKNDGKLHGSLMGYGALNSAGLICHLSLVLSEKCGVHNTEITQAIEKANKFFGFYSGKGAIPYGDHFPRGVSHDDNGKNSMAALIFDLQDKPRESQFFTAMSVASYKERENGHTGNYFSILWGPLAAQRAGQSATTAFLRPQRWFYDMNRAWDGSFPYQGKAGASGGEHSYLGWDCTGAFMLSYALPLKNTYITGKGTKSKHEFSPSQLNMVITAGEGYTNWDKGVKYYQAFSTKELVQYLHSWSPAVRERAAEALATKPDRKKAIPELIRMLRHDRLYTAYGACKGLAALQGLSEKAVPQLQKLLKSEDTWLRIEAAVALISIGPAASDAVPDLLQLVMQRDENDPLQLTQRFIAHGLFNSKRSPGRSSLFAKSINDIDRETLYKMVKQLLVNPDGLTRNTAASVFNNLSFEELQPLFPAILEAIETPSPSGIMFSDKIRISGIKLLAKHQVEEGLQLSVKLLQLDKWGRKARILNCINVLKIYGAAAKPILPELKQLKKEISSNPNKEFTESMLKPLNKLISTIEGSTETIQLRRVTKEPDSVLQKK